MDSEPKDDSDAMEALYYATLPSLDDLSHMGQAFVVLQWVKYVAAQWAHDITPTDQSLSPVFNELCAEFSRQVLELPDVYKEDLDMPLCGKCAGCLARLGVQPIATEGKQAN